MSDQCRHCSYYGKFFQCRQAECYNKNWYAVQMIKENEYLRMLLRGVMSAIPLNRDWLDPVLEEEIKEVLQ